MPQFSSVTMWHIRSTHYKKHQWLSPSSVACGKKSQCFRSLFRFLHACVQARSGVLRSFTCLYQARMPATCLQDHIKVGQWPMAVTHQWSLRMARHKIHEHKGLVILCRAILKLQTMYQLAQQRVLITHRCCRLKWLKFWKSCRRKRPLMALSEVQ